MATMCVDERVRTQGKSDAVQASWIEVSKYQPRPGFFALSRLDSSNSGSPVVRLLVPQLALQQNRWTCVREQQVYNHLSIHAKGLQPLNTKLKISNSLEKSKRGPSAGAPGD
jgi:hypothetical protein